MKIYLVEINNMESYEDYHKWIEKVFVTFRAASQYLVDEGYEPCIKYDNYNDEWVLDFYWQESDEYMADCRGAKIIEMELEE